MDSKQARRLFFRSATAVVYVDVKKPDGSRGIGSAFHVGDGVFVTARHVLYGNSVVEIRQTEPLGVSTRELFPELEEEKVTVLEARYKEAGIEPAFKHWANPLELVGEPVFLDADTDVAAFRVRGLHPASAIIRLGIHWDDWVYREIWNLTDAIVLGYPPIPMVNKPQLVSARAEIHTFVVPWHSPHVHFILSAVPRGGFSGGVAIHEDGFALGVVTSALSNGDPPNDFLAVLSIEAIMKCLEEHKMLPPLQVQYQRQQLGLDTQKTITDEES